MHYIFHLYYIIVFDPYTLSVKFLIRTSINICVIYCHYTTLLHREKNGDTFLIFVGRKPFFISCISLQGAENAYQLTPSRE